MGRQKLRQQKVLNSSPLEMQFSGGDTVPSRAAAAAGQSGLMALYDSLFGMMDLQAAQVLVTRNDFTGTHPQHVQIWLMGLHEGLLALEVSPQVLLQWVCPGHVAILWSSWIVVMV